MCENGGKRPVTEVSVGFTKEQADTIRRIRNSKDSWDMLGVKPGATRWAGVQGLGSGDQSLGLGVRVSLLLFTFTVVGACSQGGSEQSVQEAGRAAAPWQVRRPRQRRCLQGCGERSHLTAKEH